MISSIRVAVSPRTLLIVPVSLLVACGSDRGAETSHSTAPEGCKSVEVVHTVHFGMPDDAFVIDDGATLTRIRDSLEDLPDGRIPREETFVGLGGFELEARGEGCGFESARVWAGWVLRGESVSQDTGGLLSLLRARAIAEGITSPALAPESGEYRGGPRRTGTYAVAPLRALDGERWKVEVPLDHWWSWGSFPDEPVIVGDTVYFGASDALLRAVDLASGRER